MRKTPIQGVTLVTTNGTAVPLVALSATGGGQTARSIIFLGRKARGTVNVGEVYVGFDRGSGKQYYAIPSDGTFNFAMPDHERIALADIYVDAVNDGDGVVWTVCT